MVSAPQGEHQRGLALVEPRNTALMSEQEEIRDDVPPPDPDDDRLETGAPSEEGASNRPVDVEWEESESSPHAGEEGQEPV